MSHTLSVTNEILTSSLKSLKELNSTKVHSELSYIFPGRPSVPLRVSDPAMIPKAHLLKPPMQLNAYMLHSIAHIELNAVELYWDTLVRFCDVLEHAEKLEEFAEEVSSVLNEEATHFELCRERLEELGSFYGACPVHDRQWERANEPDVQKDLKVRLVILSLVQEARGLDASPRFIHKLRSMGDHKSADIVERIRNDEVKHVAFGIRWFEWICRVENIEPISEFHQIVRKFIPEGLMPPINEEQRQAAGMSKEYFQPLIHQRRAKS